MATAGASRSVNLGSDQCHQYECDPCNFNDVSKEAKCYCKVCSEYLCSSCEMSHKGLKATRDHTLVSGEDLHNTSQADVVLPVMYCDEHKKNVLSLLCKSHDAVICDECKATTHRKCVASDLSNTIPRVHGKKQYESTAKTAKNVLERCLEVKARREEDGNNAEGEKEQCLMEMYSIRKEVNTFFDKEEERLITEIRKEHSKILKEVENDLKTFESIYKQTESLEQMLRDCKATGNDKAEFIAYMKSKGKLAELETFMEEVCSEVKPFALKFQPNSKLKQFFDNCSGIGKVLVKEGHVAKEDKEFDLESWVKTLPCAVVESYGNIYGGGMSENRLLPVLLSSGLSENLAKILAGHAEKTTWPLCINTCEKRINQRATFKRLNTRKIPGEQACLVAAFENTHMPQEWIIQPGYILTFTHGVEPK